MPEDFKIVILCPACASNRRHTPADRQYHPLLKDWIEQWEEIRLGPMPPPPTSQADLQAARRERARDAKGGDDGREDA
jgi:hypothetical protein